MEEFGIYILVAAIPSVLFISLILYIFLFRNISEPKIKVTDKPLKLVGVSIKSTDSKIEKDDAALWEEFKKIREKNGIPKPLTCIVVRMYRTEGDPLYEYFIGMVGDSNNIPNGFKYLEIPPQLYVTSRHRFKKGTSWLKSATKVKFYIYDKWLPVSEYELNRSSKVKAIEVHNIKKHSNKRNTQIFVAVKKVDQDKYS